jgi:DNA-binding beta-propeller fold protein YncE
MDNLLTDHGDPEKRIADLEHQLAERQRGADLPPASPPDGAASRRFVASAAPPSTKQMMKYTYVVMFGVMASLGAVNMALLMIGSIVGSEAVWQVGGAVVFFAFLLGVMPAYGAFQRRMNRKRQVLIDVGTDGVTVNTKPGDVFPLGDARLGPWTLAGYGGTTKGTALHLGSGRHSFVLGGQDHRVDTGTPLQAPPVDNVDAWMWAPEFDEFLAAVGGPRGLDVRGPTPGQPTRCLLTPNPAREFSYSFIGMFKNTATALRLNANPPQPGLAIDVGDDVISVIDLKTNAPIASAPIAQVTATPAASTRSIPRMGTMTTPVLVVAVPDSQPLTIGCPDYAGPPTATWSGSTKLAYRFSWRGEVPAEQEPAYVVSDPDWLTLVEKFGLAPRLEDGARADAGGTPAAGGAPPARPKRKLWIYGVIIAAIMFVAVPAMMMVAGNISSKHQNKQDQQKADQERPFALPFTDLRVPHGVAVDAAGNVYVADGRANQVLKLTARSNTQTVLPFTGLDLAAGVVNNSTGGVAVDAAGNVYVTDTGHNRVLELAAASSTQTVLPFRGLFFPEGLAVDTAGAVYVADRNDSQVVKLAAGSKTQTVLPSMGRWVSPNDVAVDATGTVYAAVDKSCGKHTCSYLLRLAPGSDTWTTLPSAGNQQFVAVNTAGNLYVITSGETGGVMRLAPGSDSWTELPGAPSFVDPQGLAVDSRGNVYVTDHTGARQPETLFGIRPTGPDDAQGFVLKLPAG